MNIHVISLKKIILYGSIICILTIIMCLSNHYTNEVIETISKERLLPIYSVETSDKKVSLTFDLAWGADDILSILDTLEENDIKATFFMVGTWIDKFPDAVKNIYDNGHDIGNHSDSHPHVNKLSFEQNVDDMKKCNEKIKRITNQDVELYRGPYLEYNDTVISAAESLNMKVIQMDVDTLDYKRINCR